jgi:hypothetical protein
MARTACSRRSPGRARPGLLDVCAYLRTRAPVPANPRLLRRAALASPPAVAEPSAARRRRLLLPIRRIGTPRDETNIAMKSATPSRISSANPRRQLSARALPAMETAAAGCQYHRRRLPIPPPPAANTAAAPLRNPAPPVDLRLWWAHPRDLLVILFSFRASPELLGLWTTGDLCTRNHRPPCFVFLFPGSIPIPGRRKHILCFGP